MTSWPFFPLPKTQNPPYYRPEAIARIPVSHYTNNLKSTEPTIPWIIVALNDRKLLCRAVPSVSDTVEYVEASSNMWIPEADITFDDSDLMFCKLSGLLKKPKLAEAIEIEGDHLDNFLVFMRAALVHKPVCEGLHFSLNDAAGEERIFKVKNVNKEGGVSALKGEFFLVAPQTGISYVKSDSKMKNGNELLSFTCPPGLEGPFDQISDLIDPKILNQMRKIGVNLPRGVLMSGPPGVGKTFLVSQLAQNFGIPLKVVNGPELISPIPGESERNLSQIFDEAKSLAKLNSKQKCSIIFFDEIDAIARKREGDDNLGSLSEVRLLTQLLTLMDGYDRSVNFDDEHVMVFAATNRPNALDPAMRRPGRFDREIIFEPPGASTRATILKHLLKEFDCTQVNLDEIARNCVGYVSADLASLSQGVLMFASENTNVCLKEHFVNAMKIVGPSLHRQYQVSLDNRVTWNDIAGIDEIRNELRRYIEWPLLHADAYERMGLVAPRGVLLYGPPGCSKTTIAKAIANESGFTFYSLNGAALYSCFVGESEHQIRDIFQCARMTSPSVIFFDEIDAIVGKRSSEFGVSGGGDSVQERVLSTLLNEMDGIDVASDSKRNVLVIGATNRKDLIDEALLRPGRFDRHIYIPPPTEKGRVDILRLFLKGKDVDSSVNLEKLAKLTEGFTGADLKGLVQEAGILAMYDESFQFKMEYFEKVLISGGRRR